ncbi:asparagine synthase (glutamine-hydrolyzing) [Patescibacteria group bacterium]|nr:asparagine synthase (glutamine-hydrolyzing) [Patescibacteria group bacterium]MCG2699955.1 asparagine synthase (glutamine-hydrolyzing) [Candidatus Parcubacteria bacterium]
MCGIVGIYNLRKEPIDPILLKKMTAILKHRGPDDAGIYISDNVGLGHQRLSIIDISAAGHQPMVNKDGTLQIIFNGEIYNFQVIKKELENLGHKFKSKTDTEVILYSYEEWGINCLAKFNGMFAFAIWDKKKQQFLLARDRLGEKPLYYYFDQEKFVFASEIKAILEDHSIPRKIDNQGLVNYFTFGHSIAPDTIYQGIKKLLPGHYLIFKNGQIEIKEYWDPNIPDKKEDKGKDYYQQTIRELFEEAVKEELISDVPLGAFLSGGIDSSLVVAMMAKNGVSPLRTFSVGFDVAGTEFNELADAKIVANHFKTEHHELFLKELDLINILNKLVYHYDEPFGDAAAFPVFYLSQFAKKYVTVVLTGEGGDEIFGGYRRYIIESNRSKLLILNWLFKNNILSKTVGLLPGLRRTKKFIETISIKDDLSRYTNWLSFFSKEMVRDLFKPELLGTRENPLKEYKKYFSRYQAENLLDKIMYLDQKIWLPDCYLEKVDKASMAFGLETRSPILNHHLVEFANSIPAKYKIRGVKTKYILKEAMKDFLPNQVLNKKKHGLAVPTNIWFKGKLKNYLFEIIFDRKTKSRGYFNFSYIEKLYKKYQQGNQPFDFQFWLILNFELWHRQFMDNN